MSRYARGASGTENVTFDKNISMGVGADWRVEAHQVATALSSNANRHISTKGKSDSIGSAWASVSVVFAHEAKRVGFAKDGGVLERDLRYGKTIVNITCFTSA